MLDPHRVDLRQATLLTSSGNWSFPHVSVHWHERQIHGGQPGDFVPYFDEFNTLNLFRLKVGIDEFDTTPEVFLEPPYVNNEVYWRDKVGIWVRVAYRSGFNPRNVQLWHRQSWDTNYWFLQQADGRFRPSTLAEIQEASYAERCIHNLATGLANAAEALLSVPRGPRGFDPLWGMNGTF